MFAHSVSIRLRHALICLALTPVIAGDTRPSRNMPKKIDFLRSQMAYIRKTENASNECLLAVRHEL